MARSQTQSWATEPNACLNPKLTSDGFGAELPVTLAQIFQENSQKNADLPALHFKSSPSENFQTWTWSQYYQTCVRFAKSLISLGFDQHSRINIMGFNSKEWHCSMMGTVLAGGIPAGVYPTNTVDQCRFITDHSEAQVIVVESHKLLQKYENFLQDFECVKAVVIYGEEVESFEVCGKPVYSFNNFLLLGGDIDESAVQERISKQKPGHCCSLIYTSGTTGFPKAVMISHDNATWTAKSLARGHNLDMNDFSPNDRMVSYLPLSHIAAQLLDIISPILNGVQIFFAQPDALKGSLVQTLKEVRPTFFFGVPRVWEKMHARMLEVGASTRGIKKKIATWAKSKGAQKSARAQFGGVGGKPFMFGMAQNIVFSKVRAALGLNDARYCYVAAAPVKRETLDYFASLDIPILEVFGQSECTGPHTMNSPSFWKIGTCGKQLESTETRLDPSSGELQYRGRHIMMGYMKNQAETEKTINSDGWLMSGDIAQLDDDNFLSITGRIKELIITSGGENIAPAPIEACLKREMPALSYAMVVGEKKNFLSVLFTLQVEIGSDGIPTDRLSGEALNTSQKIGSQATTTTEVKDDAEWKKYFDMGIKAANELAVSNACTVKKWALLPTDFSDPGGELTPTLKLKRKVAAEKYSSYIHDLYS